jgi:hypothetical protein
LRAKLKETKTMKKMLILLVIALMAAPAFAGGTLATTQIPCVMVIDKTVTLTVSPAQITLNILDPNAAVTGDSVYRGYTGVTMTHNFPVKVVAIIVPFGPSLGPLAAYKVALGLAPTALPQTAADWIGLTATATQPFPTPAPAPIGEVFYVGAAVLKVDITYAPSSPTAQQVATVGLTVSDIL